ncbi:16S rRNA (cytidine(1402)-2'-O)-methyltransferase [Limosilactobacillus portuensis]|uniref:Ribosomal RNA small subunit methyltransferase I n=1 Tax=Limosilactobacillus portuensis TaxID=2742601 RepID=A0ABS6IUE3_9LACO|nr:16S rRNA (cytidine(1402)-2'-O)-methyltransferase [Limosilactobacillus portuensis]MBU9694960.1 16S rRNA (cytidine(1402)-2'-O)-methyltransferase [Limosilactobacillus portuensis]MDU1505266.1 16S rRNA (cytidine(1402)-2'-O)-methyltransferase [Limosilactobacillus vaginalis]PMC27807.1 16S rRNA (cytidine(1402)-2'-O)-methyltransferase [Gardnerella vaginalis]WCT60360.1 16S rRNA (cytidine(1402)-2'-O)-methyltransferase [Limosilactobacillus portuensis]
MQQVSSFQNQNSGTLYLVPTPIGNLDDMTFRAVKVLTEADLIAAEDTRHTQQLLNHFDIHTPEISFHEHNTEQRIPELIGKLKAGITIAQCSDAGMPSISDPGKELVAAAVKEGIPVVPLPGANAGLTALIASGLVPQPFYFYGFLERKHQQQVQELEQLRNRSETMIFYEAPHRLKKTLKVMAEVFGDDRQAVLARELTKRYEEFSRGSLAEIIAFYDEHQPRGEYVVLVAGNSHPDEEEEEETGTPVEQIDQAISEGLSTNEAIKLVAKKNKLNRQELYKQYHNI